MFARALPIADAVLFEGYLLYPYRTSSVKNQQPFAFGTLLPVGPRTYDGSERSHFTLQAIALGDADVEIRALVRFLELAPSGTGEARGAVHEVALPPRTLGSLVGAAIALEVRAGIVRGCVELGAERVPGGARITLRVENLTRCDAARAEQALARREPGSLASMAAAHALLGLPGGRWLSPTDPGDDAALAASCACVGVWPALVGDEILLASPIILPDQPTIAPESVTSMFDGLEIDEILSLRILTMTDDEKDEMRSGDPRGGALLARVEALEPEALARLHGAWRERSAEVLRVGDRVRLAPRAGADAMDFLLAGRSATVAALQHDVDAKLHVAVTIDDDPGRDLGAEGRKPGHRFYFGVDEVERIDAEAER